MHVSHKTSVFLPGESHGRRSMVGYSPWGRKDLDSTEQLHFHFSCLVLVSHWTWAAAGRGMVFSSQGNPKRDGGWRLLLTAFPQQGQVFYLDRLCTVLLLIHSSLPLSLTSPLFIHLMGEFPPGSIVFFFLGKTYKKVVTEMNYNLLPSAYSWSRG